MKYCINYRPYNYNDFDINTPFYEDTKSTEKKIAHASQLPTYNEAEREILNEYLNALRNRYELQKNFNTYKRLYNLKKGDFFLYDTTRQYCAQLYRNSQKIHVYENDQDIQNILLREPLPDTQEKHQTNASPHNKIVTTARKSFKKNSNGAVKFCIATFLILAIFYVIGVADIDYGYYTFLRILTFIALPITIFVFSLDVNSFLTPVSLVCGIIVILFNPIVPIYLDKGVWSIIDIICAISLIGLSIYAFAKSKKTN